MKNAVLKSLAHGGWRYRLIGGNSFTLRGHGWSGYFEIYKGRKLKTSNFVNPVQAEFALSPSKANEK